VYGQTLISSCDVSILLSNNEGSPISVKEVLACGKPVIVNDVGDLTEYVIQERNGYIVNPDDESEIASAILKSFENSSRMKDACAASMLPYNESIIYSKISNHIFGYNSTIKFLQ